MNSEHIEVVSVKNGKFHFLDNPTISRDRKPWEPVALMCGLVLEPVNYFVTVYDADEYTGGRLSQFVCKHCEAARTKEQQASLRKRAGDWH